MSVIITGGIGTTNYQWQRSVVSCSGPWTNISGTNSASYTTPQLFATTYYRVRVSQTGSGCDAVFSACAKVTVNDCVGFELSYSVCTDDTNPILENIFTDSGTNPALYTVTTTPIMGPKHGVFSIDVDGDFSYDWTNGFVGQDSVIVQICEVANPTACGEVTIYFTMTPSVTASAGIDQTLCDQTYATLNGNAVSGATVLWSQVSGPSTAVMFLPNNSSAVAFNLILPGVYVFQYAVSNGGCTATDQVTVNIYDSPTVANAGADQLLCEETTFTMGGNTALSGTGTWSRISGPDTPTITSPNSPTTTITPTSPGTYVYRWTISNTSCPDSYDEVTITNSQQASGVSAGVDATICETAVPYQISGATASNYTSLLWSTCSNGCGTFSNPTALNPTFTPTASDILNGFVILKLTAFSAEPCDTVVDQMVLTIKKQAVVNAGIDITVCQGEIYGQQILEQPELLRMQQHFIQPTLPDLAKAARLH
jgi:hypothetical protein